MPDPKLDPKIQEMFEGARVRYVGNSGTAAAQAKRLQQFNKLYNLIKRSPSLVNTINQSFIDKILKKIDYYPSKDPAKNPSGRSGFGSETYKQGGIGFGPLASLRVHRKGKNGVKVKKGTLYIGDDMINIANRSVKAGETPNSDGLTADQATAMFIVAHEFGIPGTVAITP